MIISVMDNIGHQLTNVAGLLAAECEAGSVDMAGFALVQPVTVEAQPDGSFIVRVVTVAEKPARKTAQRLSEDA